MHACGVFAGGSGTFEVWSSEPTAESSGTAEWAAIDDGDDVNPVIDRIGSMLWI